MSELLNFTLHVDQDDGLSVDRWHFCLVHDKLVVDTYTRWTKASKRHKAVAVQHWSRLDFRASKNDPQPTGLKEEDVPLTPSIQEMAKQTWLRNLALAVSVGFQNRAPQAGSPLRNARPQKPPVLNPTS